MTDHEKHLAVIRDYVHDPFGDGEVAGRSESERRRVMGDRDFDIATILTLITGVMVGESFGEVHALAEHVAGHSIWTHEFAEKALWERLKEAVFAQHPKLATHPAPVFTDVGNSMRTAAEVAAYVGAAAATFGPRMPVARGTSERSEHPLASLDRISGGKPVTVVDVKGGE